ncbi:hypothetical protein C1I97_01575 [Streptomyces sp. NTH33]|uniref:hypothetical protein n=1 Tax=Streptomyces sp. NTH33 TaxID=1735453 RepID=UPI000DA9277D|nr:hypothetical protein [Streptomyces sp. NTH33]PZH20145.1 hypothetical protein C1I97_01575 [Streptomyces sp. NTH33]
MSVALVRRPTEEAAIAAVSREARPLPPIHVILADLLAANRAGDRHGVNLCAHRAVRAAAPEVGE